MGYTGNVFPIPLANGGLNGSKNYSQIPFTDLIDATNISMDTGVIQKDYGETQINSGSAVDSGSAIVGGTEYFPVIGTQRQVVATTSGKLFKGSGTGTTYATTLKTGLGTDKMGVFVEGGQEVASADKHLFFFNGNNVVQVLDADGATTHDITTPSVDWSGTVQPVSGVIHDGRLFAWGNTNNPHMLYYSSIDNHENFSTSGALPGGIFLLFPGVGDRNTAGISAFGRLYIFKNPVGIFQVNPFGFETDTVKIISTRLGCSSPRAIVIADSEIWFQSAVGSVHVLSGVNEFGDVKNSDVTALKNLNEVLDTLVDKTRLDRAVMVYDQQKRRILLSNTKSGSSRNDILIVIDISQPGNPKFSINTLKGSYETLWIQKDTSSASIRERPVSGGSDGIVYNLVSDNRYVEAASSVQNAYNSSFQTAYADMSPQDPTSRVASINKHFDFVEPIITPTGNYNLNANIYVDGVLSDSVSFNLGGTGTALGSFILDSSVLGGSNLEINRKVKLSGCYGRRISIQCYNNNANQNYKVSALLIHWRPGEEGLVKG